MATKVSKCLPYLKIIVLLIQDGCLVSESLWQYKALYLTQNLKLGYQRLRLVTRNTLFFIRVLGPIAGAKREGGSRRTPCAVKDGEIGEMASAGEVFKRL